MLEMFQIGGGETPKRWVDDPINWSLPTWEQLRDQYENFMTEVGLGDYIIDEVALMFITEAEARLFVEDAVKGDGVKLFNVATDEVETHPIHSSYTVDYRFLECKSTMRVEIMNLTGGFSPLHHAGVRLLEPGIPMLMHFSFKVESEEAYSKVLGILQESAQPIQWCKSTYGQFAYFRTGIETEGGRVFLKPRVNTRDDDGETAYSGMPTIGRPIRDVPQA